MHGKRHLLKDFIMSEKLSLSQKLYVTSEGTVSYNVLYINNLHILLPSKLLCYNCFEFLPIVCSAFNTYNDTNVVNKNAFQSGKKFNK